MKESIEKNLKKTIPLYELQKCFAPLRIAFDEKTHTLSVTFPHAFFQTWFLKAWQDTFERAAHEALQESGFQEASILYISPQARETQASFLHCAKNIGNRQDIIKQDVTHQFFYNSKNDFPIAAATDVALMHIPRKYNPFIIYGESATGKTHILGNMHKSFVKTLPVFFEKGEKFWDLLRQENLTHFLARYAVFIIDDIHRTVLDVSLQEKFLHFMDTCCKENKQLIVTCLHAPANERHFFDTMRSRLYNGLVVQLKASDIDVRMRYAQAYAKELDIKLSRDHLLFLTQRCEHIPFLRGILNKIQAFVSFSTQELTTADLKNILLSSGGERKKIETKSIIAQTALHFSLQEEDLLGSQRTQSVVKARQIAIYLCRELLALSSPALGKVFGGRDHSTIIHSINKVKKLHETDSDMQNSIEEIKKKLYI